MNIFELDSDMGSFQVGAEGKVLQLRVDADFAPIIVDMDLEAVRALHGALGHWLAGQGYITRTDVAKVRRTEPDGTCGTWTKDGVPCERPWPGGLVQP